MIPSIVTFKWKSLKKYRSDFSAKRVNLLRQMVLRHYPKLERFICVTDDPTGLDPKIETYPLWDDWADVPNPTWPDGPSCFRRLKIFDPWFETVAGKRFAMIDIDMVPVADLSPIFERPEPFVIWQPPQKSGIRFCASLMLMDAGVYPSMWSGFDPAWAIDSMKKAGCRGSDQGWLQLMLGDTTKTFTDGDGVHSYASLHVGKPETFAPSGRHWTHYKERARIEKLRNTRPLPKDARLIIFTGKPDPWDGNVPRLSPWIGKHYCA